MAYYLKVSYELPINNPSPDDFVGPFEASVAASNHRLFYGPVRAEIVQRDVAPAAEHTMSPEDHVAYVESRD